MMVQQGFGDELEYDWLCKWWWFYVCMWVLDIHKFWNNCLIKILVQLHDWIGLEVLWCVWIEYFN